MKADQEESNGFSGKFVLRPKLTLTPTKSDFLALEGIEDWRLKESNVLHKIRSEAYVELKSVLMQLFGDNIQPIVKQFLPAALLLYKRASDLFMRLFIVSFSLIRVAPIEIVTYSLLFS